MNYVNRTEYNDNNYCTIFIHGNRNFNILMNAERKGRRRIKELGVPNINVAFPSD